MAFQLQPLIVGSNIASFDPIVFYKDINLNTIINVIAIKNHFTKFHTR